MLTGKQKALLNQVLTEEGLKELTLQQAQSIAARTKIPLKAIEWFALKNGVPPRRYRYNLGSLDITGQTKLLESKVIVVGLGGLGGYVVEELARLGLGKIVAVDPDVFEETNLNRQLLAEEANLGKKKVDEANSRSKRVNKAVEFTAFAVSLDKLPEEIWSDADLVFDCLDNIKDRLILANTCSMMNVPLVHGAIAGWYGQVCVIWPKTAMLNKIYQRQNKGIEQDIGNPPFTAAMTASLMVAEAVKILTGKTTVKEQKMLFFDLLQGEWQTITF